MRSVLPCSYQPKHAAPREPLGLETRSVLAVGLAAAVLPFGATPALADGEAATSTATTSSTTATSAAAPEASAASTTAGATPSASPSASAPASRPSRYDVGASAGPTASPSSSPSSSSSARPAAARQSTPKRASTSVSISVPSAARGSKVPVGIRLLADGKGVRNGFVRIEKSTSSGWTYAGRLLTDRQGLGKGTFTVAGSTRLRAAYTGSQVRTPAVSAPRTVSTSQAGGAVLQEAAEHVGKPYRYGAVGPDSFDCSGFTRYVYAQATGKSLPHNSRAQESMATPVSKAEARPGDLVFIQDVAGHVGIYAGDGKMYDAPRSGKTVTLRRIWTSNYTVGRV